MIILMIVNLRDHDDNEVDDRDEANSAHPEIEVQKLWPERENEIQVLCPP